MAFIKGKNQFSNPPVAKKIEAIISRFLIKWIKEDKQDMGIGTLRKEELAKAIYDEIL